MRVQCVGTCVRTFTYARVCVRADQRSCVRICVCVNVRARVWALVGARTCVRA